jgi:hypothetical protein
VNESASFRARARHCRELAKGARDEFQRNQLNSIATDLEIEATQLDAEQRLRDEGVPEI